MPVTLPGIVRQLCQPPVLATAKLPTGAAVRLSSRTSTSPLTPAPAPEATRALKVRAGVVPKSTFRYSAQSPLAIQPMFCPPPASEVASCWMPPASAYDSAWMVEYALTPPPGGGVVGGGVVGGVP